MSKLKRLMEDAALMRAKIRADLPKSDCPHPRFYEIDFTWRSMIPDVYESGPDEIWHRYLCLGCGERSHWFTYQGDADR